MGELMRVTVREDQRFCAVCGKFYTKKDRICPNLLHAVKAWYSDPAPICNQQLGLTPEVVREEVATYLKMKVKSAVLESIVNAKST